MKTISQTPVICLQMEKDHPKNITGMQLKVWLLNNRTELIIRLYRHDKSAIKNLWNKNRTLGEISDLVIKLLEEMKVIKDCTNWKTAAHRSNELSNQDEIEEKQSYIYFSWFVKPELLNF